MRPLASALDLAEECEPHPLMVNLMWMVVLGLTGSTLAFYIARSICKVLASEGYWCHHEIGAASSSMNSTPGGGSSLVQPCLGGSLVPTRDSVGPGLMAEAPQVNLHPSRRACALQSTAMQSGPCVYRISCSREDGPASSGVLQVEYWVPEQRENSEGPRGWEAASELDPLQAPKSGNSPGTTSCEGPTRQQASFVARPLSPSNGTRRTAAQHMNAGQCVAPEPFFVPSASAAFRPWPGLGLPGRDMQLDVRALVARARRRKSPGTSSLYHSPTTRLVVSLHEIEREANRLFAD